MPANSNTLTLTLEVDDKGTLKVRNFAGEVDKAVRQSSSATAQGAGGMDGMAASTGRLTGAVKGLGPALGITLGTAAIAGLVRGALELAKAADEIEAAHKRFNVTFQLKEAYEKVYTAEEKAFLHPLSSYYKQSEGASPEFVGDYGIESRRSKSYAQDIATRQKTAEDFETANIELWKKSVTYGEESFDELSKLSERTAEAMQRNFSDLFFDVMQGKFKSWQDYVTAIFASVQRAFADMAGQMATQQIFGKDFQGGGLLSSILNSFGGSATGMGTHTEFSGGGTMGSYMALVRHAGGMAHEPGPMSRVPAWMIASAPPFHDGLLPDEIIAKIRKDEGVFTPGQMKALGNRSLSISVPINITAGDGEISGRLQNRLRSEMEETSRRVLREEMR
jgi:hypothetical protein